MTASKQNLAIASLLIAALVSGCASTAQFREPVAMSVEPQVQEIELGGNGLLYRAGCAFEAAVAEPRTRIGEAVIGCTFGMLSASSDPHAGIVAMIPIVWVGIPTALVERGATFAGNLGDLENYGRSATRAETQLAEAAKQADVAAMFRDHLAVTKEGDLRVIVRSVKTKALRDGGANLIIKAEVVDSDGHALRKYTHKAFYRGEHPDLLAKRRTPTRAIQAGIAEIAKEIVTDFTIASTTATTIAAVGE